MKVTALEIPDVKLIEPTIYKDERGLFFESYNHKVFCEIIGHDINFVQDNHSISAKGVLRGLHIQSPPYTQGKLVRVVKGEVYDVALDCRRNSPTFGKYVAQIISSNNFQQLWIPEGFAHGFIALTDTAEVCYKVTNFYAKENELCIRYDDPLINIVWPSNLNMVISAKDLRGVSFKTLTLTNL